MRVTFLGDVGPASLTVPISPISSNLGAINRSASVPGPSRRPRAARPRAQMCGRPRSEPPAHSRGSIAIERRAGDAVEEHRSRLRVFGEIEHVDERAADPVEAGLARGRPRGTVDHGEIPMTLDAAQARRLT